MTKIPSQPMPARGGRLLLTFHGEENPEITQPEQNQQYAIADSASPPIKKARICCAHKADQGHESTHATDHRQCGDAPAGSASLR